MNKLDAHSIKSAALSLGQKSEEEKNKFLQFLIEEIRANKDKIIDANIKDLKESKDRGSDETFLQRLKLDEGGVKAILKRLLDVKGLSSEIGKVIENKALSNGMRLRKVRVAIGVIAIIYEARPEVTVDVTALCIKSGNAVILKGGKEASRTNKALYESIRGALKKSSIPVGSVTFLLEADRKDVLALVKRSDLLDLVIARGGYGLVKTVEKYSRAPVLAHSAGGARIYVDQSADLEVAHKVILNSKISKPAACNSLDTILVHKKIFKQFVPAIADVFKENNVLVLGDAETRKISNVGRVKPSDWAKETLGLKILIKEVRDCVEAINFINKYSKKHSEGIIARNKNVINEFTKNIDTAALFINCSTRFHDGYMFEMGAEMGIATGKIHARGPVALKELTTYRWEAYGSGQIRE